MNMKSQYISEIKLFFWKHLLLDNRDFQQVKFSDFSYYRHVLYTEGVYSSIDEDVMPLDYDLSNNNAAKFILELAKMNPPCVELSDIIISPDYFNAVDASADGYAIDIHQKAMTGGIGRMGGGDPRQLAKSAYDNRKNQLQLPKSIEAKVNTGAKLTVAELTELLEKYPLLFYPDIIV